MNHEFKPGDLAIIVSARSVPGNIGRVVELLELLEPEQISTWRDPSDDGRVQNADDQAAWLVVGDGVLSYSGEPGFVLALPRSLMPLRGDEDPDATLATERPAELVSV